MNKSFYIDSCIYLNLWQKEVRKGLPFWEYTLKFLEKAEETKSTIYYSGFILKEISFILSIEEFLEKKSLFERGKIFKKVTLNNKEFNQARRIESEINFKVSFYDIIHMLLAKKTKSVLITRDKRLYGVAKIYNIEVRRPEELL